MPSAAPAAVKGWAAAHRFHREVVLGRLTAVPYGVP